MKRKTQIFSIFHDVEAAVAEAMIKEGKCNRIPRERIPPTAVMNELGERALFAIVVPGPMLAEFERRIDLLRV